MPAIKRLTYTHDAMIDLIIAHPQISNNDLAASFGYSAPWVSMIKSSDAFKARLAARRGELVDPTLVASVEDRIKAVTERALEVLAEKLEAPSAYIPDNLVMRAAEFGAKAMGIGQTPPPPAVDQDHYQKLAERLLALQAKHRREDHVASAETVEYTEGEAQGAALPAAYPALQLVERE